MGATAQAGRRRPVTMALPFDPSSAATARDLLRDWLIALGAPDDVIEDSRLVLSELVGNALRHAAPLPDGTVEVAWDTDRQELSLAVSDGGSALKPRRLRANDEDESGRGLSIVEALAGRWWLETSKSRSTVHALIHLV